MGGPQRRSAVWLDAHRHPSSAVRGAVTGLHASVCGAPPRSTRLELEVHRGRRPWTPTRQIQEGAARSTLQTKAFWARSPGFVLLNFGTRTASRRSGQADDALTAFGARCEARARYRSANCSLKPDTRCKEGCSGGRLRYYGNFLRTHGYKEMIKSRWQTKEYALQSSRVTGKLNCIPCRRHSLARAVRASSWSASGVFTCLSSVP